jgi:type IX secretion system PorP/SprF family membrane protein
MKKLATHTILLFFCFFPVKKAGAQTDICLATHHYNRINFNPSSIVRPDYLYLFSNARMQWLGVKGAPKVYNIQASEYINDLSSAFGFSLISDNIGVTKVLNPMFIYAYRISDNRNWSLSMGLSAGVFSRSIDGTQYEAETIEDPSIAYSVETKTSPDVNLGFEFQNTHFVVSLSSTHLLAIGKSDSSFLNSNHRYLSVLYRNTDQRWYNYNFGLQLINRNNLTILEASTYFRFKYPTGLVSGPQEVCELGAIYRTSRQLTLCFGLNMLPNFRIGYYYTQSFISGYYLSTTHEIMLEYRIRRKEANVRKHRDEGYWYN